MKYTRPCCVFFVSFLVLIQSSIAQTRQQGSSTAQGGTATPYEPAFTVGAVDGGFGCGASDALGFYQPANISGSIPSLEYSSDLPAGKQAGLVGFGLRTGAIGFAVDGNKYLLTGKGSGEKLTVQGNYLQTRFGDRFVSVQSAEGEVLQRWDSDGSFVEYTTVSKYYDLAHGFDKYLLPTVSRNLRGWVTQYVYASEPDGTKYLTRIIGDSHGALNPQWEANFNYAPVDGVRRLIGVNIKSLLEGAPTTVRSYEIVSLSGFVQLFSEKGANGEQGNVVEYAYYQKNFPGLLQKITNALGGTQRFEYGVVSVNGKNIPVVNSITSNDLIDDYKTTKSCTNPIFSGSRFIGFASVESKDPSGQSVKRSFSKVNDLTIGLPVAMQGFAANSKLINEAELEYGIGNNLVALKKAFIKSHTLNGTTSAYAIAQDYDFTNARVTSKTNYGLIATTSTLDIIQDDSPSDTLEERYEYAATTSSPYVYNQLICKEVAQGSATISAEEISYVAGWGEPEQLKVWNNIFNATENSQFGYDDLGRVVTASDSTGLTTQFTYSGLNVTSKKVGTQFTQSFTYGADGILDEIKNFDGTYKVISYDGLGRATQLKTMSSDKSASYIDIARQDYSAGGSLASNFVKTTLNDGKAFTGYLDGFGRAIQSQVGQKDIPSIAKQISFGTQGIESISDQFEVASDGIAVPPVALAGTAYSYYEDGTPFKSMPMLSSDFNGATTYNYGLPTPLTKITTSPEGRVALSWSGSNESGLTFGTGNESLSYTATKNPTARTHVFSHDKLKVSWKSEFDSLGRLTKLSGDSIPTVQYNFLTNGLLNKITSAGSESTLTHDSYGRVTKVIATSTSAATEQIDIAYDTAKISGYSVPPGQVAMMKGPNDVVYFTYDKFGRMEGFCQRILMSSPLVESGKCYPFKFVHNDFGQIAEVIYPNGLKIKISHDKLGRPQKWISEITSNFWTSGVISEITKRNADGEITERLSGGGKFKESIVFDEASRLPVSLTLTDTGTGKTMYGEARSYFKDGRLKSKTVTFKDNTSETVEYSYDSRGWIKQRKITSAGTENVTSYNYDDKGRPINAPTSSPAVTELKYDGADALLPSSATLENSQVHTLEYTPDKELKTGVGGINYQYNVWGDLIRSHKNGDTVEYKYSVLDTLLYVKEAYGNSLKETFTFGPGIYDIIHESTENQAPVQYTKAYVLGELSAFVPRSERAAAVIATLVFPTETPVAALISNPVSVMAQAGAMPDVDGGTDGAKPPKPEDGSKPPPPPPPPPQPPPQPPGGPNPNPTETPRDAPWSPPSEPPNPPTTPQPSPQTGGAAPGSTVNAGPCQDGTSADCGVSKEYAEYVKKIQEKWLKKYADGAKSAPCEETSVSYWLEPDPDLQKKIDEYYHPTEIIFDPDPNAVRHDRMNEAVANICFFGAGFVPGSGFVEAWQEYTATGLSLGVCVGVATELPLLKLFKQGGKLVKKGAKALTRGEKAASKCDEVADLVSGKLDDAVRSKFKKYQELDLYKNPGQGLYVDCALETSEPNAFSAFIVKSDGTVTRKGITTMGADLYSNSSVGLIDLNNPAKSIFGGSEFGSDINFSKLIRKTGGYKEINMKQCQDGLIPVTLSRIDDFQSRGVFEYVIIPDGVKFPEGFFPENWAIVTPSIWQQFNDSVLEPYLSGKVPLP